MVTKGTLTEGELLSTNPDANYLMSLTEGCLDDNEGIIVIGVCVVDVSTNKFMLGQVCKCRSFDSFYLRLYHLS